jgi:hypothetical protein
MKINTVEWGKSEQFIPFDCKLKIFLGLFLPITLLEKLYQKFYFGYLQ